MADLIQSTSLPAGPSPDLAKLASLEIEKGANPARPRTGAPLDFPRLVAMAAGGLAAGISPWRPV